LISRENTETTSDFSEQPFIGRVHNLHKKMIATLSWDELFQVLLFLPVADVCHHSQTNSVNHDCIMSNQHLWTVLLKRDFAHVTEHLPSRQELALMKNTTASAAALGPKNCCNEMKDYVCYYAQIYHFPFDRVEARSKYNDPNNQTLSKILFGVPSSLLNQAVMDALKSNSQLVIPQDGAPCQQLGIDFTIVPMASRQPKFTPNWTIQLWTIGQGPERFRTISKPYYRAAHCLVITVDTRHAWLDDDTYTTTHSCSGYGSNSLSKALAALKESKPHLNLTSPRACKGVLIVGVGVWSEDAPISKQRFLNDCAQVFDLLPLEYFELTCDNVHVMSDIILRRFYTFHQQVVLEDLQAGLLSDAQMAPKSRCLLS